jgi:CBS domain-containing protein
MKAEDWMTHTVHTCSPETSMNEAAYQMWAGDYGVLPVVDPDRRVVGMITDRDMFMGAHFQGKRLEDMTVADSMSRYVYSCLTSDPIEEVIRTMGDKGVRRIPVLDQQGKLAGILSLNDLARHLVALGDRERSRLTARFVEALAAICESRACAELELKPVASPAPQPAMVG